ncbi:MAG: endonuclease NucS [Pirellulales bacterium]
MATEALLEQMIVAAPKILSDEWMLIGRQEDTGFGGRIDLLAIAPDGSLVLIELKRNRTPREVVAQAIDYAGWVEALKPEDVAAVYARFAPGRSLADDFKARFGLALDEESLNASHQIIVVASSLDDSTERIVAYLNKRDIPINVLCFQVFTHGTEQLLSRSWLLDPVQTQENVTVTTAGPKEPWNGEFYAAFGAGPNRSWEEAVEYGFISAGGGTWYTKTLRTLNPGDRIWVLAPGYGYVGVGRVAGRAQPAKDFRVLTPNGEKLAIDVLKADYHREFINDPEQSEYFVPVEWIETVPLSAAFSEIGLFGNQNTVCRPQSPKWRNTVERLQRHFTKTSAR